MRKTRNRLLLLSLIASLCGACGPTQQEIEARDKQADYHYQLAYGHFFNGQNAGDAALQEVLMSLRVKDQNPDAHLLAGLIFLGRKMHPEAIHHFKTADAQKKNFLFARNNLGVTYLEMESWDEAIKIFEELVKEILYKTPGHAHNNLGWAYYKKGMNQKAKDHFLAAIDLTPQMCIAYNNLGVVYLEEENFENAEKYLNRGIKRCKNYAEPYYHLSRILIKRADYEGAIKHLRTCVTLGGESSLADRCQQRLKGLDHPT
ncbi:tetratricopeptide repeat protein [Myxococcota bacterium]|nr:tetratricopeptide repeat protein [Myxococcota bacterium]MBU1431571.1 tetratricopeptide repeat protein [Myxococcota bacterium]